MAVFLCVAACDCKDPEGSGDGGPDGPNPNCGNSEVDTGETCDDANNMSGDGCSSACLVEDGYTCPTPGQACLGCGDEIVQAGEQCDDGGNAPNDGCSATCQREPGWDCIGDECTPSACGDGFRVGAEGCDDGNRTSGDGCSIRCDVEPGWYCATPNNPCAMAVCGDSSINAQEQCDDGDMDNSPPGCDANCQIVPGYHCPTPGQPCVTATCGDGVRQGLEQCDDGGNAAPGCSATCQIEDGYHCPTPGQACVPASCGNGVREGLEECDDGDTATGDGCDDDCDVEAFYECEGSPQSVCEKPIEFVRIARFEAPMQQPQAVHYDPRTRSFVAYDFNAGAADNDAQEFCLDGEKTEQRDAALELRRDLVGGTNGDGALDGAAYDPFRDTFLFVQQDGRLSEIERTDTMENQVTTLALQGIGDLAVDGERAGGIQVGDDGRIYVTNHYERLVMNGAKGSISAFARASNGTIMNTRLSPFAPRTLTGMNPPTYLDNIFNIPGVQWIGYYNLPQPPLADPDEQAFMFHRYDGTFIGRSTIPGILFRNGEPFPHNADGGEAAVDGGYFLVCSEYLDEPGGGTVLDGICQLFAQTCNTTADCVERVPGTICKLDEPIPYCYAPAVARNDRYTVAAMSGLATFDVMMNDSFADSVCSGDPPRITSVTQGNHGGTVAINGGMDRVQYTPMGACGYMETFTYTADLGGGAMDSATVTVTVPCNCGNNVIDAGEECDGTAVPAGRTCTPQCRIRGICGNTVIEAGEECDDGNTVAGDLCSPICTNEIIID